MLCIAVSGSVGTAVVHVLIAWAALLAINASNYLEGEPSP